MADSVGRGETGKGRKADQKDNVGPIVNHNNHNCEPFREYYVAGTVLMLCKHFFESFQKKFIRFTVL